MNAIVSRLGDPAQAFWLTRSTARAIGLNLSEAMQVGALSAQQYAEMVTRCRMCPHVASCQQWLATRGAHGAEAVPETCANAERLNQLARRLA